MNGDTVAGSDSGVEAASYEAGLAELNGFMLTLLTIPTDPLGVKVGVVTLGSGELLGLDFSLLVVIVLEERVCFSTSSSDSPVMNNGSS